VLKELGILKSLKTINMASYWDIDDFLAGEEQVQVKSVHPNLFATLRPPNEQSNSASVAVPLYLAQALESRSLCTTITPPYLTESFQGTLETTPSILNLPQISPNFYFVSAYFACKDPGLTKILCSMFLARLQMVFKHVGIGNLNNEILKMACFELKITKLLRRSEVELKDWKGRKHEKVAHSYKMVEKGG